MKVVRWETKMNVPGSGGDEQDDRRLLFLHHHRCLFPSISGSVHIDHGCSYLDEGGRQPDIAMH